MRELARRAEASRLSPRAASPEFVRELPPSLDWTPRRAPNRHAVEPSFASVQPSICTIPCLILDSMVPTALCSSMFARTQPQSARRRPTPYRPSIVLLERSEGSLCRRRPTTNFQQVTNCSSFSPRLDFLYFHALTNCPIRKSFVLIKLQQCRGWGGPLPYPFSGRNIPAAM